MSFNDQYTANGTMVLKFQAEVGILTYCFNGRAVVKSILLANFFTCHIPCI
jgi:hypothetical protein